MNLKLIASVAAGVVLVGTAVTTIVVAWRGANEEPTPEMLEKLNSARENLIAARNKDN